MQRNLVYAKSHTLHILPVIPTFTYSLTTLSVCQKGHCFIQTYKNIKNEFSSGSSIVLPKNSDDLFSRHTLRGGFVLNPTPLNLSLLPQPPFSCHHRRFTSPNSAPSLQELLQDISLSLTRVPPNPTNPLDPPLELYLYFAVTGSRASAAVRTSERRTTVSVPRWAVRDSTGIIVT